MGNANNTVRKGRGARLSHVAPVGLPLLCLPRPQSIVRMEKLPRNTNGKIDRKMHPRSTMNRHAVLFPATCKNHDMIGNLVWKSCEASRASSSGHSSNGRGGARDTSGDLKVRPAQNRGRFGTE